MDHAFSSSNHRRRGHVAVQAFMQRGASFQVANNKGYLVLGDLKLRMAFHIYTKMFLEHFFYMLYDERLDSSCEEFQPEDGFKTIFESDELSPSTNEQMWISKGVGTPLHVTDKVWEKPGKPGYWRLRLTGNDKDLASKWETFCKDNRYTYRLKGKRLYFSNTLAASLGLPPNVSHLGLLKYKLWRLPGCQFVCDGGLYEVIKWKLTLAECEEASFLMEAACSGVVDDRLDDELKDFLGMERGGRSIYNWFSRRCMESL